MKRILSLGLALLCLLGCGLPGAEQTPQPDAALPGDVIEELRIEGKTPEPEPVPVIESVLDESAFPHVWIEDGAAYGCSIVCFIDGFGLCYDLENLRAGDCRAEVERAVTQDIEPFETHRLLLHAKEETLCLGEIRYDKTEPNRKNLYGVAYDLVVMDSDLTELDPVDPDWVKIAPEAFSEADDAGSPEAGLIESFDTAQSAVFLYRAKTGKLPDDMGFGVLIDTIADEPVRVEVPESAILSIIGDEYEMPITQERFFLLLEHGYIGFLPPVEEDLFAGCYIGIENNTVRYLREMDLGDWDEAEDFDD